MLHTCQESREEALKVCQLGMRTFWNGLRYSNLFPTHLGNADVVLESMSTPQGDTIYLRRVNDDKHFTLQDLIRDIADRELQNLHFLAVQQAL
jgi:hypothetical protein